MSDISTQESPSNPEVLPAASPSSAAISAPIAVTNTEFSAGFSKIFTIFVIAALAISMLASFYLWRKLTNMQEHLARQSADATNLSVEARSLAKNAQDVAREASARSSLNETRLSEVALQRGQC
jgi:uroporphyrin-III C-methyltransferase